MFELTLIRHYLSLWTKHDFCINQDIWMFIENIILNCGLKSP